MPSRLRHWLFTFILAILHICYSFFQLWKQLKWTKPGPLAARRIKIPKHLSLVLVPDPKLPKTENLALFLENLRRVIHYAMSVDIEKLSVYDMHDYLSHLNFDTGTPELKSRPLHAIHLLPLTPPPSSPPSDGSHSRPPSPNNTESSSKRFGTSAVKFLSTNELYRVLYHDSSLQTAKFNTAIISSHFSKPALVSAARNLAATHRYTHSGSQFQLDIPKLHDMLETSYGFPSPDLIIVHHLSGGNEQFKLHGYPPWQLHLTEIYLTQPRLLSNLLSSSRESRLINQESFCGALDSFAGAEFRVGR